MNHMKLPKQKLIKKSGSIIKFRKIIQVAYLFEFKTTRKFDFNILGLDSLDTIKKKN
jgi:hypothetical protein